MIGLYSFLNDLKDKDIKDIDVLDKVILHACRTKDHDENMMINMFGIYIQVHIYISTCIYIYEYGNAYDMCLYLRICIY